jgi:DNA-binding transcriptional LysR family regulator
MPAVGYPSFEQLQVLATVAETGSFSAAARQLGRAQSVISYAIGQLEAELGIVLFDRSGRLPRLTEAGSSLLEDARRASGAVSTLRARAAGLQQGVEAELKVGADVMMPMEQLVGTLKGFADAFPLVNLRLSIEALGGVAQLVLDGTCDLGVGTELPALPDSLQSRPIGSVRLIPVAAPSHPLARPDAHVDPDAVRNATQIVLTDRTALSGNHDIAVLSLKTWRIGDLGAKHALLREGLGWGNMPEHLVRGDLAAGRLVRIDLPGGRDHDYPLVLIQRRDRLLGRAAAWFCRQLDPRAN